MKRIDGDYIRVEKGIQIPKINTVIISKYKKYQGKYPFDKMSVGDSFLWPKKYSRSTLIYASNCARNFCKKNDNCKNWKFSCRKWGNDRLRIWRVK